MKGLILEILWSRFNYYMPDEDLLITIIDFENEYEKLIKDLNNQEKEVLTLYSYKFDTFKEVADELGFSRQYIHRVYQSSINKIINNVSN